MGNFKNNRNPNCYGKAFQRSIGSIFKRRREPSKKGLDNKNRIVYPLVHNQHFHLQLHISILFYFLLLHNLSRGFVFVYLRLSIKLTFLVLFFYSFGPLPKRSIAVFYSHIYD
jgi:hypothetical protein